MLEGVHSPSSGRSSVRPSSTAGIFQGSRLTSDSNSHAVSFSDVESFDLYECTGLPHLITRVFCVAEQVRATPVDVGVEGCSSTTAASGQTPRRPVCDKPKVTAPDVRLTDSGATNVVAEALSMSLMGLYMHALSPTMIWMWVIQKRELECSYRIVFAT